MPSLLPDAIATYAGNCTTVKSAFSLGDIVCAKVTDGPSLSIIPRRVALVDPSGNVREIASVSSIPGTVSFTLPSSQTTTIDGSVFDNRGAWKVNVVPGSRLSVRTSASLTVSDPQGAITDLFIYNSNNSGGTTTVGANGTNVTYTLWLGNRGPDVATNVAVTDVVPANATFVSAAQELDPDVVGADPPVFNCQTHSVGGTDTVTCTIASLASRKAAKINLIYQITSGSQVGTVISNVATIASDTEELLPADNTETSTVTIIAGAAEACSLACPANISRTATTTVNNMRGTNISFSPEASGDCGAITSSPASGSFFPVGTTTVNVSSAGGGSCSFTVTVTDEAGPAITCPPDQLNVAAPTGSCEANVNPGTATATGTGVTVEGERSDGLALSDPYPNGVTTITWTATDSQGRAVTCVQTIKVTGDDTTPPTIKAPNDINVGTGQDAIQCAVVIGDGNLGTAEADDNCSASVKITRTGVPAGNLFPKGTTTITYTATDGAGLTATATQKVTVVDNTKPVIYAPADAAYTCPSEVPAASPSQAGGPLLDANGQPMRDSNGDLVPGGQPYDNCGGVTVAVSETRSGAGSASSPRVIARTFTATDGSGNSSSAVQTITVVDDTPPAITAPTDKVLYTGAGAASCGVTISDLDGTLGSASASDNCAGATVARSGVPSGSVFPVGDTIITYTATDAAGNQATATQKVTVIDNTAPVVTPPAAVTLNTGAGANSCGVSVSNLDATLGTGSATDNCSGVGAVTRSGVPSGSVFPVGTTTVTYSATDAAGNVGTATQTVTVVDNTPPVVTAPANITVGNDLGTCTAMLNPGTATATDNCVGVSTPTGARSDAQPLNAAYPKGTTTITWTATDAAGNPATAQQTVTVNDTEKPVLNVPANITVNNDAGSCSALVSFNVTATDNCGGATVTTSVPSGASFPKGTTTVTATATDTSGNTSTASFTVTVNDTEKPVLHVPADIVVSNDVGSCSALVDFSVTATDNCGAVTVTTDIPSHTTFAKGTTTVKATATDSSGNISTASFHVTVNDTEKPVVNVPANIVVTLPPNSAATSMAVSYAVTATDNCPGIVTLGVSPASGSTFNVGTTTVTATATDASGNITTRTFTVTVLYNFAGFFSPVSNLPTLNVVNAGRAIPVKFSLSGNKGLNIFAANSPLSGMIPCDLSAPATDLTDTVTAGASSLSYSTDQYSYVWKTESSWAGTCRQLEVTLNDGSVHRANFKFK